MKQVSRSNAAQEPHVERTDGRVVLFDEVILNQLDGQRRLANTTFTKNNLRRPSVYCQEQRARRGARRAATHQLELGHLMLWEDLMIEQ